MGDLFAWLLSFFILIAIVGIIFYQILCLLDLETDYINPHDSAARINFVILPEFVTFGLLCLLHLITGHWPMLLLCLPYLYYNVNLYIRRRHLMYATEIFHQLPWEKKIRLCKLGYLGVLIFCSIFWMIWSIVDEDYRNGTPI